MFFLNDTDPLEFGSGSATLLPHCHTVDPHCFDADPEPDPDPAQNLDADPDPDPDPDPGGGGGRSAKNGFPPGKKLGTPLLYRTIFPIGPYLRERRRNF